MSKWQEKWDKKESEIITFKVGEKVWYNDNIPGIIRDIRKDESLFSITKYEVQIPLQTLFCSYYNLKKVHEEDL